MDDEQKRYVNAIARAFVLAPPNSGDEKTLEALLHEAAFRYGCEGLELMDITRAAMSKRNESL